MWRPFRKTRSKLNWAKLALGFVVGAAATHAKAEPAEEGTIVHLNVPAPVITQESERSWRSQPIQFANSGFLRLHFTNIHFEGAGRGTVTVIGQGGDELAKWTFAEFAARGEHWTRLLPEGFAVVQVHRDDDQPVRLQFKIREAARESKGGTVLSRQDPNHIKDKDISTYTGNAAIMGAAKSVAKINFPSGAKLATCTGFMVTENLMLTNHHCVNTLETCFATIAIFGYQRDASGHIQATKQYDCIAVVATDKKRDYSLLRIAGGPGADSKWGVLKLGHSTSLANRQPLYMIQHPSGEPKRVALEDCSVTTQKASGSTPSLETDFGHKCDTESGSSGSPILDLSDQVVGLHHMGFDAKTNRWSRENRAVHIGAIAAEIDQFLH